MNLSLWIHPNLQFGQFAPGEARQGVMRQSVAQAIQHHFFENEDAFKEILEKFTQELSAGINTDRPAANSLWESEIKDNIEKFFGLAIHGLCSEMALGWQKLVGESDEENEEDDDGDNNDVEATIEKNIEKDEINLMSEYTHVLSIITNLLRQAVWRWWRDYKGQDAKNEDLRLIANVLLDRLLTVLGDWFTFENRPLEIRKGKPYTPKYIVAKPELAQRIKNLVNKLPFRFTLQPLRLPVAYKLDNPGPSDSKDQDYFRIDLIGYRQTNQFLRELHYGILKKDHRLPEFDNYLAAVNHQQAVPWRINRELRDIVTDLTIKAIMADSPKIQMMPFSTGSRKNSTGQEKIVKLSSFLVNS